MKILLCDTKTFIKNGDIDISPLENLGNTVCYDNISRKELLEIIGDFDAAICNKTVFDKEVLSRADNLKYIGLLATGYNNIDINEASKRGITVCNAGTYSTDAVAQQTFAYILHFLSRVADYDGLVKSGKWENSPVFSIIDLTTDELKDKTLGIIGYGSIGKRVADIALAFNMKVLVFNRSKKQDERVNFADLDYLLENSDIVTVHCPLNEQSADMFCKETFNKMKDGAYFINTARGGIVVEEDLKDALNSGKLSGAAVDVLRKEPMDKNCPLKQAKNIIITPHTSWAPQSTRKRLFDIVYNNLDLFLKGTPQNVVSK